MSARSAVDRPAARSTASAPVRTRSTETRAARPDLKLVSATPARRGARRSAVALGERRAPFVLLVVALLVGTTLSLLFLNIAIGSDSIKAGDLRTANAELAHEVESLQQKVVEGSTPVRLAAAATAAGLVPAGSAAYLVIAPDGSSSLRGSVTPAPEPPRPSPAPGQSSHQADGD